MNHMTAAEMVKELETLVEENEITIEEEATTERCSNSEKSSKLYRTAREVIVEIIQDSNNNITQ
ncbi:19544_t:CDS:2, partial [Dentiscutata erythropus]